MTNHEHGHDVHTDPHGRDSHPENQPYWKRAHRGWPFWVAVFFMLLAMIIYLATDDLGGWGRRQPRQPASTGVGN